MGSKEEGRGIWSHQLNSVGFFLAVFLPSTYHWMVQRCSKTNLDEGQLENFWDTSSPWVDLPRVMVTFHRSRFCQGLYLLFNVALMLLHTIFFTGWEWEHNLWLQRFLASWVRWDNWEKTWGVFQFRWVGFLGNSLEEPWLCVDSPAQNEFVWTWVIYPQL